MSGPAYTRLNVDERRRQIVEAGSELFAEHAFDEISMQQIARVAGVSKPLLYHYFPSKLDLFKAAVAEKASELAAVIQPPGQSEPVQQLREILDAYLEWIDRNARVWAKLMQSASSLPEAGEIVESFRAGTMEMALKSLTGRSKPRPALRLALNGWLGYIDAAILDWIGSKDVSREQLREILVSAFVATLMAAQQVDPKIRLG